MIFLTQLVVVAYFIICPSLSHAQDATLYVGSSSGFVGSNCCNPYTSDNKVVISLDNQSEVTYLWVNIDEEGSTDYLTVPDSVGLRCETTTRAENLDCTVSELASGKTRLVLDNGVIGVGTGAICTLGYDVKEGAPGGGACRALNPTIVDIEPEELSTDTSPGQFCFNDCSSNEDCDDGEVCTVDVCNTGVCTYTSYDGFPCDDGVFCNGADICLFGDCTHLYDACPPPQVCNEDYDVCNCDPLEEDECHVDFCEGDLGCVDDGGPEGYYCKSGPYPCDGYDGCNEAEDVCYDYDDVTLDIGTGSGYLGSSNRTVPVYLDNQSDVITGIQLEVCDAGDDLTCTACDPVGRAVGPYVNCDAEEIEGCCKILLYDTTGGLAISEGYGTIINIKYDVKEISEGASTGVKDLNPETVLMQDDSDPPNNLYAIPLSGVFDIYCISNEQCDDELYCNGSEICVDLDYCEPGGFLCDPYFCCDEDADMCIEQDPLDDYDCDGVPDDGGEDPCTTGETSDCDDNCPEHPNGPSLGYCGKTKGGMMASYRIGYPKHFITCESDDDCEATGGACQREQGDCNDNGVGDVCECYVDANEDGMVAAGDYGLIKNEYLRADCPLIPGSGTGDTDGDGVIDEEDNCPEHPNGETLGTCVKTKGGMIASYRVDYPKHFITCESDDDCVSTGGTCQREQGDCNGNGVGDVCECYTDANEDGMVAAGDYGLIKNEYLRSDCPPRP